MTISDADKNLRAIAVDIIRDALRDFEFLTIAEDEDLGELPEERQEALYRLITTARITATWGGSE